VLRDIEVSPLLKEISKIRIAPFFKGYREVLGEKRSARQKALLAVALSFYTWRTLVREEGLSSAAAARQMAETIIATN